MLKTEQRNEKSLYIDKMSTREMLNLINEANYEAVKAVEDEIPSIEKACDAAAESIARGGRLIYIGAGTSGRLGVLDASECPPTFGVSPDTVIGIIAGGYKCLYSAAENEEDKDGVKDIEQKRGNVRAVALYSPSDTICSFTVPMNILELLLCWDC